MKKFLITVVLSLLFVPSVVGAVDYYPTGIDYASTPAAQNSAVQQALSTTPATTPNVTGTDTGNKDDFGCLSGAGNAGQTFAICLSNLVYYPMVGLGSWFAYIAAFFFDYAVQLALNSSSYAMEFIATTWGVARDIANMAFLFILLYIGYTIMLKADTAGTTRMLVGLVVAALLVNFSFVMTRVVIDTGNIIAVQFYNAIGGPNAQTIGQTAAQSSTLGVVNNVNNRFGANSGQTKDLTASIMNALQIQSITNSTTFQQYAKNPNASVMFTLITLSAIYVAMGIMFFILAGSFLYAGVKFIIRIVGLWIVIFTAPIAFVSAIFKFDKGALGKGDTAFTVWLRYLFMYSFYPAVYLFMFWVLTLFAGSISQAGLLNGIYNATSANLGTASFSSIAIAIANVAVRLGFLVAMLYLCLSIADKISGYANGAAGWVQGKILSGAAGSAWTGGARWLAQNRFAQKVPGLTTAAQVASWADVRNVPGIGATLRGITGSTGKLHSKYGTLPVDYGKGSEPLTVKPPWRTPTLTDVTPADTKTTPANVVANTPQPIITTPVPISTPRPVPRLTYNPGTPVNDISAAQLTHNSSRVPMHVEMDNEALEKIKSAIKTGVKKGVESSAAAPSDGVSDGGTGVKEDLKNIKEAVHTLRDPGTPQAPPPPKPATNITANMNFYERLGVDKGASLEEIKSAFKDIAKQVHPDVGGDVESFKLANEAYQALKDDRARSNHNFDIAKGHWPKKG